MPRIRRSASAHDQIVRHFIGRIDAKPDSHNKLRDGARLAGRRKLVEEWPVSYGTLNKAFAELIERGYLETREGGGGGTYVVGPERRQQRQAQT